MLMRLSYREEIRMREYVKIYCCGYCVNYNWKKHKCSLGAKDEGKAQDNFYRDCPLGIHVEKEDERKEE